MRCPNCGTEIKSDSIFCMECGHKLFLAMDSGTVPPANKTDSEKDKVTEMATPIIYCPTCGIDNKGSDTMCRMCGGKLHLEETVRCAKCGNIVSSKNSFCPGCGSKLQTPRQPTPPGGLPAIVAPPPVVANAPVMAPPVANRIPTGAIEPVPKINPVPPPAVSSPEPLVMAAKPDFSTAGKGANAKTIYQFNQPAAAPTPLSGKVLSVISGFHCGEKFPFTDTISLGKTSGDITFPSDDLLDSRQAQIKSTPHGIQVIDMSSVNGIYYKLALSVEITQGTFFCLGPYLFEFENILPKEWSLNSIWERGVKLNGTSRNMSPWGRLKFYSPVGICAGVYLLWNDSEIIGNSYLPEPEKENAPTCRISRKRNSISMESLTGDTYIRIDGEKDFSLPVHLKIGGQIIEVTPA
ncbi:MAG: zinc ribbon domain-containing protein [Deltaproteobacteria bacterium]|nr:zinc ribbon domain-containing protein [Deltaproteobacteria bacterium]